MRIGIDLDGVIFDTERLFRFYADKYDVDHHGTNNIIDLKEVRFQERYNWTDEEKQTFYKDVVYAIEKKANLLPGVYETLRLFKEKGYKLYIITARGIYSKEQIDLSIKLLKKCKIDFFDEYIFGVEDKKKEIIDHKIDIMIDDNINICENISDVCIPIYLKDIYSYDTKKEKIITMFSWADIYRYFKNK